MSPRNFWNHPLQELARSLARTFGPDETGRLTTDEFTAFLGRLVGTAAQGPGLVPHPVVPSPRRKSEKPLRAKRA